MTDDEMRAEQLSAVRRICDEAGLGATPWVDDAVREIVRQRDEARETLAVVGGERAAQWDAKAPGISHTFMKLRNKLQELRSLPYDWDSYGGSPPADVAIAVGERVLEALCSAIHVSALPSGGVQFDMASERLMIEVDADGKVSFDFEDDPLVAQEVKP